jgi:nitric oxide dioxygenase
LKHIDNKAALFESVELACQKHCALIIQAEHYPIVYECFFHAVGEVLGEAVTPEIRDAWSTYVLFIARVFIERELQIYEESSSRDYGWFGFKVRIALNLTIVTTQEFVLVEKKRETDTVYTYVFEPKDGRRLPSFQAGQYITLKLNGRTLSFDC